MNRLILPNSVGGSALVRDYLLEKPTASAFFRGSPLRLESYRDRLKDVQRRFGQAERAQAARALRPTSDAARERLERFVRDGGAMITTGQQAGFLSGPLYTVFKALTAVALAKHLEEQLDTLVIPVFWIASDDHDWAEVNHAFVLDHRNRARRFELTSAEARPLPMSERVLEGDLDQLCDYITETVSPKPHTMDLVKEIVDPYRRQGRTVAEAFGMAMTTLLRPFDVCITDSADPELKRAAIPVLRGAIEHAEAEEALLIERTAELAAAGYSAQVAVMTGGTNVFHHGPTGRERLYRSGDRFAVRAAKERFDRDELITEVENHPERFSPNVFLRPVVESWVFPTLAYVGGPGELAYFAQANALFQSHGIIPPVVTPRFSGIVLEPKVERLLSSLGLRLQDLLEGRDQLIERLARREIPQVVTSALASVRENLARDYEVLLDQAGGLDPTLLGSLGAVRNRSLAGTRRAERAIVRAVKRGDRISIDQLDRVLDSLRPMGDPQDRVLNVLSFLATFGEHFLHETQRAIQSDYPFPTD